MIEREFQAIWDGLVGTFGASRVRARLRTVVDAPCEHCGALKWTVGGGAIRCDECNARAPFDRSLVGREDA